MAIIIKENKPLVTQPLKTSPATGATLASMGFQKTIPLMHGSQGCGAFTKVFLIQHLREPIPLQNTAIDQVSAVMGGDDNLTEALALLCEKQSPEMITVMTTGLTEMQGSDLFRVIAEFKRHYPQYAGIRVVSMQTPDFVGSMQTGFAHAVDSVVKQLVRPATGRVTQRKQINVLCSLGLTGADIETLRRYIEAFDLDSVIVPDISLSLDGHLDDNRYSSMSTGGTSVLEVEMMSDSVMTLVMGPSLVETAKWLEKRFAIPYENINMGMDITSVDKLIMLLANISGKSVPGWITRARRRLQDAMLDSHFILSSESMAIALEPDLAIGYGHLLDSMGIKIERVVTSIDARGLKEINTKAVMIGDLAGLDVERSGVALVISNTHAAKICEPSVPVLRVGYPCHDQFGNMDIRQFGFEGCRERLFALANLLLRHHVDEVAPHFSRYRFAACDVKQREVV
jgi:nitrogenase molybdenum-iron protein NifN